MAARPQTAAAARRRPTSSSTLSASARRVASAGTAPRSSASVVNAPHGELDALLQQHDAVAAAALEFSVLDMDGELEQLRSSRHYHKMDGYESEKENVFERGKESV